MSCFQFYFMRFFSFLTTRTQQWSFSVFQNKTFFSGSSSRRHGFECQIESWQLREHGQVEIKLHSFSLSLFPKKLQFFNFFLQIASLFFLSTGCGQILHGHLAREHQYGGEFSLLSYSCVTFFVSNVCFVCKKSLNPPCQVFPCVTNR